MSRFSKTSIGEKWRCPMCGSRLEKTTEHRAFCNRCNRGMYIMLEDPPRPDSKTGKDECGIKLKHPDEDSAIKHLLEVAAKPDLPHRVRGRLCIYRCRLCPFWHVGHRSHRKHKVSVFKMLSEIEANFRESTENEPASTGVNESASTTESV